MKSKTSCYKSALVRSAVRRFSPVWGAYLVLWLLLMPAEVGRLLSNSATLSAGYATRYTVLINSMDEGGAMTFCFALFSAMCVFSFMYSARSANAMAVLPIKRSSLFLTQAAIGIVPLLIVNVLVFLVTGCVEAYHGAVDVLPLLEGLAIVSVMIVLYFGIAALCAQLTGNIIFLPVAYVIVNFAVFVLESVIRRALVFFVYGLPSTGNVLTAFSPVVYLWEGNNIRVPSGAQDGSYWAMYDHTYVANWGVLIAYLVVGVIFIAVSLALFRRKRVESAGDVVAVKMLKPVFKYCFALGGALVLGTFVYWTLKQDSYADGRFAFLLILMLLGGFVCYFAAEMLIKKSFRVWNKKAWVGFAAFAVIFAAVVLVFEFDLFGYEKKLPDTDKIAAVGITNAGDYVKLEESDNIAAIVALHERIIADKSENEQSLRAYNNSAVYDGSSIVQSVKITYYLESGRTVRRQYWLTSPLSNIQALEDVLNTQEAINYRKQTAIPVTVENIYYANIYCYDETNGDRMANFKLTAEEAYELYTDCILPDMQDGTLGKIWLIPDDDYYSTVYSAGVQIELQVRNEDGSYEYDYFNTTPTTESVRTMQWFKDHGYDIKLLGDTDEDYAEDYADYTFAD